MDRDKRWDRTRRAFDLLVSAKGIPEKDPLSAVNHAYRQKQSDEFITQVCPRVSIGPREGQLFASQQADTTGHIESLASRVSRDLILSRGYDHSKELSCPVILEHANNQG